MIGFLYLCLGIALIAFAISMLIAQYLKYREQRGHELDYEIMEKHLDRLDQQAFTFQKEARKAHADLVEQMTDTANLVTKISEEWDDTKDDIKANERELTDLAGNFESLAGRVDIMAYKVYEEKPDPIQIGPVDNDRPTG